MEAADSRHSDFQDIPALNSHKSEVVVWKTERDGKMDG